MTCLRRCFFYDTLLANRRFESTVSGKIEEKSLVINEKSQNTFQKTIHKSEPHNSHFLLWVIFGFILTRVLLKINNKGE